MRVCHSAVICAKPPSKRCRTRSRSLAVFTKVCRTAGHYQQKSPPSSKYHCNTGQAVRWNFRGENVGKCRYLPMKSAKTSLQKIDQSERLLQKAHFAGYRFNILWLDINHRKSDTIVLCHAFSRFWYKFQIFWKHPKGDKQVNLCPFNFVFITEILLLH